MGLALVRKNGEAAPLQAEDLPLPALLVHVARHLGLREALVAAPVVAPGHPHRAIGLLVLLEGARRDPVPAQGAHHRPHRALGAAVHLDEPGLELGVDPAPERARLEAAGEVLVEVFPHVHEPHRLAALVRAPCTGSLRGSPPRGAAESRRRTCSGTQLAGSHRVYLEEPWASDSKGPSSSKHLKTKPALSPELKELLLDPKVLKVFCAASKDLQALGLTARNVRFVDLQKSHDVAALSSGAQRCSEQGNLSLSDLASGMLGAPVKQCKKMGKEFGKMGPVVRGKKVAIDVTEEMRWYVCAHGVGGVVRGLQPNPLLGRRHRPAVRTPQEGP